MATYTLYAATSDGIVSSNHVSSYASARAGGSINADSGTGFLDAGQAYVGIYLVDESFLSWDTSAVAGTATIATVSLYGADVYGMPYDGVAASMEIRAHGWGPSLTTADWVPGDDLASKTLLASMATGEHTNSGYNVFTSDAALLSAVDLHGSLEVVVALSRTRLGDQPSSIELLGYRSSDTSGTAQDPRLDITTVEGGAVPVLFNTYRRRRA